MSKSLKSLQVEFHPPGLPRSGRFIQSLILFRGGGEVTQIYFSWVETSFKVEFHPPRLPRHGRFMVGDNKQKTKNSMNIPLVPMGVLAPVSAHMGPSAQPPIGTSGNYQARMSAESISPNFPIFRSK